MRKNYIQLKQDGFTLLEVLVSVVLLFIVLTSFFSFFSQSLIFSGKNEEDLVAFNLARKTLKIVEGKYNEDISANTLLNCTNFPTELKNELVSSQCYYQENQKKYYPEITLKKQTTSEYNELPILYVIHVKIYNSNTSTKKLLSETFGYIRGA
jgi:prepilin-type N-terminal cleavage/methylation domain-containing protein